MVVQVPWQENLFILYISSTFIMVRSIFRIAEYVQGNDGTLLKTETCLYIFDATLMFLAMLLFNVFHPSNIISKATLRTNNWASENSGGSGRYGKHFGLMNREDV